MKKELLKFKQNKFMKVLITLRNFKQDVILY